MVSQMAIIDCQGRLVYEAFASEYVDNASSTFNLKPLRVILQDFLTWAKNRTVVCHYAEHDIEVLKRSFKAVGLNWQTLNFICTWEFTKVHFPNLPSYGLEYLSKYLNLQVDKCYFNPNFAHSARYDAAFTYQLFLKIKPPVMDIQLKNKLHSSPNPFSASRVDTPFQNHLDLKEIYQDEFLILKSVLNDVKKDINHQSKGVLVVGEAGAGKTHLMMRLAQELLKSHRLLFIRQPNNPDTVLYHIYSRILESFVENVPGTSYSQIEYLLAKSFSNIVINILNNKEAPNQKERQFVQLLSENHLNLYKMLGAEGTDKKYKNWQLIEKLTLDWWRKNYSAGGYSYHIIKGLIKFCSYSNPHKRELISQWLAGNELEEDEIQSLGLENWTDNLSREEFSLEAIKVFSELSIKDEPLIIIFDQLEGLKSHQDLLLRFGEVVKELFTWIHHSLIILNVFPDRWAHFKQFLDSGTLDRMSQYQVTLPKPDQEKLRQILALRIQTVADISLEELFTEDDLNQILMQHSIRGVLNYASHYYRYKVYDIPLPVLQKEITATRPIKQVEPLEIDVYSEIKKLQGEVALIKQVLNLETSTLPVTETKTLDTASTTVIEAPTVLESENNPLVLEYLKQQETVLEQTYHKKSIITDSDDIGKVLTIVSAFKAIRQIEMDCLRMGKKKLPEHVVVKTATQGFVIAFLHTTGSSFVSRLKNFNELVITYKELRFGLLRDSRLPAISGRVSKEELEKLNNSVNGKFILLQEKERIHFELMYKCIVDLQNKDLEVNFSHALSTLESYLSACWLIKLFQKANLL